MGTERLLYQFFAGNFHQDWSCFHESENEAIKHYISEVPVSERAELATQLRDMIARTSIENLPYFLCCLGSCEHALSREERPEDFPGGYAEFIQYCKAARHWVESIAERMEDSIK